MLQREKLKLLFFFTGVNVDGSFRVKASIRGGENSWSGTNTVSNKPSVEPAATAQLAGRSWF